MNYPRQIAAAESRAALAPVKHVFKPSEETATGAPTLLQKYL